MKQKKNIFLGSLAFLFAIVLSSCGNSSKKIVEKSTFYDYVSHFELSFDGAPKNYFFEGGNFTRTIFLDDQNTSLIAKKYYGDYIHGRMQSSFSPILTEQGANQEVTLRFPLLLNLDEKTERLLTTTLKVNDVEIEPQVEQGYYAPLTELNRASIETFASYMQPTSSIENQVFTVLSYQNQTDQSQSLKLSIKNYDYEHGLFVVKEGTPQYRQINGVFQIEDVIEKGKGATYWFEGSVDAYYAEDTFMNGTYQHPSFSRDEKEIIMDDLLEEEANHLEISKDNFRQALLDAQVYRRYRNYMITMNDIISYCESIHPLLLTYSFTLPNLPYERIKIEWSRDVYFYTPKSMPSLKSISCYFFTRPSYIYSNEYYKTYISFLSSTLLDSWEVSLTSYGDVSLGNELDDYQYSITCYSDSSYIALKNQNEKETSSSLDRSLKIIIITILFTIGLVFISLLIFSFVKRNNKKGGTPR